MQPSSLSGLPAGVGEALEAEGVAELYPPQEAAVEAGVADGESLVAAVPTASGKTLIAELAMLSSIERGGKAPSTSSPARARQREEDRVRALGGVRRHRRRLHRQLRVRRRVARHA